MTTNLNTGAKANYDSAYENFLSDVPASIRRETYGDNIGQHSWTNIEELQRFSDWLKLKKSTRLLDLGSGAGGPALFFSRKFQCEVRGLDANSKATAIANLRALKEGLEEHTTFSTCDANQRWPLKRESFDAAISIDVVLHLQDRERLIKEFRRVLRPGGRLVFSDGGVITGAISNHEISQISNGRYTLYVPIGYNEMLLIKHGFRIIRVVQASDNAALIASGRIRARKKRRPQLRLLEGSENFTKQQSFLEAVVTLAEERRLSRFIFVAERKSN